MNRQPYDYSTRQGILPISWEDFHGICRALSRAAYEYKPEIVLAIGRGGFYPGTLVAHMLRVEIYPVRVSRRVNDKVKFQQPQWRTEPPEIVKGKRVLMVDEICGAGVTVQMVKDRVSALGASEVRSAVMYAHTRGAEIPDYVGLITDELLLNPWDREIFSEGEFEFHPEYVEALALQGIEPDESLYINATPFELAKG